MKLTEFAKKIGISQPTLTRYIDDTMTMPPQIALEMASVLGIFPWHFIYGTQDRLRGLIKNLPDTPNG